MKTSIKLVPVAVNAYVHIVVFFSPKRKSVFPFKKKKCHEPWVGEESMQEKEKEGRKEYETDRGREKKKTIRTWLAIMKEKEGNKREEKKRNRSFVGVALGMVKWSQRRRRWWGWKRRWGSERKKDEPKEGKKRKSEHKLYHKL